MERPSTLKNHCELKSGLTDKPDTVLESSDDSEPNQWGWFFDFFGKIFCTGPLSQKASNQREFAVVSNYILEIAGIPN